MSGITKVFKGDYTGKSSSPAFCNRTTGELYINTPVFEKLNRNQQFYVLLHEDGHITLQTESEDKADDYASRIYLQKGYPLSESVKALSQLLKFNKEADYTRLKNQFNRAANYDLQVNHNQKILEMKIPNNVSGFNFDDLGGLFNSVTDYTNKAGNIYNTISGMIPKGNNGGGGNNGSTLYIPRPQQQAPPPIEKEKEKEKDNTFLYLGIGSGLLIITLIIIVLIIKRKK